MEKIILLCIGAAALGYLVRRIWMAASGKTKCSCSNEASCTMKGCSGTTACSKTDPQPPDARKRLGL